MWWGLPAQGATSADRVGLLSDDAASLARCQPLITIGLEGVEPRERAEGRDQHRSLDAPVDDGHSRTFGHGRVVWSRSAHAGSSWVPDYSSAVGE